MYPPESGSPLPLLPSNFPSKIFFTNMASFILIMCPSHSNLRIFITVTVSWDLYLVINSKLVLILHCPVSFVGPYTFLTIFLSHVINIFSILFVKSPCLCSVCHSWSYDCFIDGRPLHAPNTGPIQNTWMEVNKTIPGTWRILSLKNEQCSMYPCVRGVGGSSFISVFMFNPQVNDKMKCDLWLKLRVCCHPIRRQALGLLF